VSPRQFINSAPPPPGRGGDSPESTGNYLSSNWLSALTQGQLVDLNGGKVFALKGAPAGKRPGLRGPGAAAVVAGHHAAAAGGPQPLPAQLGHLVPAALHRPLPGRCAPLLPAVPGGGGRRPGPPYIGGGGAEARRVSPSLVQVEREGRGVALAVALAVAVAQLRRGPAGRGSQTADPQQALEGLPELQVGAGVDDRVDAAVEVAQPEGDLEDGVRRSVRGEHGACVGRERSETRVIHRIGPGTQTTK